MTVVLVLELCRGDAAEFVEEAAMVEPVDPFEGGEIESTSSSSWLIR